MPDIGTMHQLNPEPPHIGTMHQIGPEPLHTGEIITPQAQAEEYAREAQESADNAALSAAAAQSAAETAQQAAESIAPALDEKAAAIHTAAGPAPIVSIPDAAAAPVDALTVWIEPVQDLHGYDNPWPAGGGKNLANLAYGNKVPSTSNGQMVNSNGWSSDYIGVDNSNNYVASVNSVYNRYILFYDSNKNYLGYISAWSQSGYVLNNYENWSSTSFVKLRVDSQESQTFNLQLELGSTATAYAPYSNICPITGWTGAKVYHSGEDTSNPTELDVTFPTEAGTVYGGTLDLVNGTLTVDRAQIASYNGETLPGEWISDRDVYAAGTTPTTGAQVVYELATLITYTLTPQEIRTLLGTNNIWADTGDVTVGYKADTKLYIDKKFAELQALILEH